MSVDVMAMFATASSIDNIDIDVVVLPDVGSRGGGRGGGWGGRGIGGMSRGGRISRSSEQGIISLFTCDVDIFRDQWPTVTPQALPQTVRPPFASRDHYDI